MKILSLFDGISCARVSLERAGIPVEVYYASEIDKYAIQISQKNYPGIKQVGSVVGFDYNILKGKPDRFDGIDLLIGGSPCQDLSIAKKDRKGLDGERSGLFWEYVRILNEVKPKYFILENVASMPKEAKQIITEALGVEPIMINASLVSAQNRKRLFWVGKWNGEKYEQVEIPQPEDRGILLKDILDDVVDEKFYVFNQYNNRKMIDKCGTLGTTMGRTAKQGYQVVRVGSLNSGGQGDRIYSQDGKSVALSANGGGRGAKTGLYAVGVASRTFPRTKVKGQDRVKQIEFRKDEKANSMTSVSGDSMVATNTVIRKLTPIECERLQGLPDNYTEGVSNTQRYKVLGNAFNVDVVAHILSFINKLSTGNPLQ